jgi:hypothetical protein
MNPSGDLGEHCSSAAAGHVLCGPPGRVAQPPMEAYNRREPKAGAAGRRFFAYFLWPRKESRQLAGLPPALSGDHHRAIHDSQQNQSPLTPLLQRGERRCAGSPPAPICAKHRAIQKTRQPKQKRSLWREREGKLAARPAYFLGGSSEVMRNWKRPALRSEK